MFFAVLNKHIAAVRALLEAGACLEVPGQNRANADSNQNSPRKAGQLVAFTEVICKQFHTSMSVAPAEVLPVLQEARNSVNQRGRWEDRSLSGAYLQMYTHVQKFCMPFVVKRRLYPTAGDFCGFKQCSVLICV